MNDTHNQPMEGRFYKLSLIADVTGFQLYDLRVLVFFGDLPAYLIEGEAYVHDPDLIAFMQLIGSGVGDE